MGKPPKNRVTKLTTEVIRLTNMSRKVMKQSKIHLTYNLT